MSTTTPHKAPPRCSGGLPWLGHLLALRRDPLALMQRVHDECGEIGELNLAGHHVVMLYGAEAQEAFFRAPDEQLDQAAAYPFMKPVFGAGVVFDASPEQRKQAMKNRSFRDEFMRGHAERIASETERMLESWGDSGEIDLLDFFAELTIYTSTACIIGPEFREELTSEYFPIFYDLERGTDAIAYVNPNLPLPAFRTRDRARERLVGMIEEIFARREREGTTSTDLFQVLHGLKDERGEPRYPTDVITGMFISMMFAGHHTTSVSSSWAMIELLRHPEWLESVTKELDALFADGRDVSYQALREIPRLECALKESLRLHPPLVLLLRKVVEDFEYADWLVPAGKTVGVSVAVSNRMPEHFPEPDEYRPERYQPGREEDKQSFAWIPFGAGRHRCVGAAFAMMQLKTIFSILLHRYEFELAQPADSYRNDLSKMVVAVQQPCRVRYRRRQAARPAVAAAAEANAAIGATYRIRLDRDLCQGHGVCVGEAPDVFELDREALEARIRVARPGPEQRAAVLQAVRHCPTQALSISDEPEPNGEV
jgi:sterol 14-demethylase